MLQGRLLLIIIRLLCLHLEGVQQPESSGDLLSIPSKIEWDLTNGPLSKLLEPSETQV